MHRHECARGRARLPIATFLLSTGRIYQAERNVLFALADAGRFRSDGWFCDWRGPVETPATTSAAQAARLHGSHPSGAGARI